MKIALLTALALVVSCSDAGADGSSSSAGAGSSSSRVVRIDPYSFDAVVDRMFDVSGAVRVRAPGPLNRVTFTVVPIDENGDAEDDEMESSNLHEGDLDIVVAVDLETFELDGTTSRRIVARSASIEGDRSFTTRAVVDHLLTGTIGAISAGTSTSAKRTERGDAHVLREWSFNAGTESQTIRLEMTVDAAD